MRLIHAFVTITFLIAAAGTIIAQKRLADTPPSLNKSVGKSVGECHSTEIVPGKTLRTVTFSVLERSTGHRVGGVRSDDLVLFENDHEKDIEMVRQVRETLSIVLLIDTSPSTKGLFNDILISANRLLAKLAPNDELSIFCFDGTIRESVKRQKVSGISRNLAISRDTAGTRLYDTVEMAIKKQFRTATGRKVLIIFSDGIDTTSENATDTSTLRDAVEADARVYAVQYPYLGNVRPAVNSYFLSLTEKTGGSSIIFEDIRKSPDKIGVILNDAAALYTLCYWSDDPTSENISLKMRGDFPQFALRRQ